MYNRRHLSKFGGSLFFMAFAMQNSTAWASGYQILEHSAAGLGNAFAGAETIAEDASTTFLNPAGMIALEGRQIQAGMSFIFPNLDYTDAGSRTPASAPLSGLENGGGEVEAVIPNFYYVMDLAENWKFGIALNVPFGLATHYDDDWIGRYHGVESNLQTINLNPNFAYKINDRWSVGFGLSVQRIDVTLSNAVDLGGVCAASVGTVQCSALGVVPQTTDGFVTVEGNDTSLGGNFGIIFKRNEKIRYGFSYRSNIKHELQGNAEFLVPASAQLLTASGAFTNGNGEAKVDLPAHASFGAIYNRTDRLTYMFSVSWTEWSRFDELRVTFDNPAQPDAVVTEEWDDTVRYALGVSVLRTSNVKVRLGIAFDPSPIPNDIRRTVRVPDGDRTWLSAGLGVRLSEKATIDIGYTHLLIEDEKFNNTLETTTPSINHTLVGEVESVADIVSAQLRYWF